MFDVGAHTNADTHIGKTLHHKYKCILTRRRAAAEVFFLFSGRWWEAERNLRVLTVFVILMPRCMIFK